MAAFGGTAEEAAAELARLKAAQESGDAPKPKVMPLMRVEMHAST